MLHRLCRLPSIPLNFNLAIILFSQHTKQVQLGLRNGMLLFIFSELLFFISFFWAFFIIFRHNNLLYF
ncbi:putative cytochrome c oxidase subunit III, cytochrome c oxidase, subunit III, 4-helical bundle [Plasmopara halstedii]